MSETQLQRSIQQRLELMPGVRCWRCNAGQHELWSAKRFRGFVSDGKPQAKIRRVITYGLRDLAGKVAGTQDLIVCAAGLFIGLEVKLPGKKPTHAQLKRQQETREAGGISEVVYSVEDAVRVVGRAVAQQEMAMASVRDATLKGAT